jgi:hypothetical protein
MPASHIVDRTGLTGRYDGDDPRDPSPDLVAVHARRTKKGTDREKTRTGGLDCPRFRKGADGTLTETVLFDYSRYCESRAF